VPFAELSIGECFSRSSSVPAVAIATLARSRVVRLGKWLLSFDPRKLGRLEKSLNTLIRILVVVGFGFLIGR
jgi:hypothetical protein